MGAGQVLRTVGEMYGPIAEKDVSGLPGPRKQHRQSPQEGALPSSRWAATLHNACTPQEVRASSDQHAHEEENRKDTADKHKGVLPPILGRSRPVSDMTPQPISLADVLIRGSPAWRLAE